jgi:hypothetical protein
MDFYRPGLVEVDSPLIDGRSPHMLDPDRTQTLVDTLQFYLQQPALRAAIASEGRSRFMSRTCISIECPQALWRPVGLVLNRCARTVRLEVVDSCGPRHARLSLFAYGNV